jgi:phosphatidylserine/phosphatidylglycerophosphate/cardiolipin synthase-like enzyme
MLVEGQAAYAAFQFANVLWDYVRYCAGGGDCAYRQKSYRWTVGHIIQEAPPGITVDVPPAVGDVPIIAAGRAGMAMSSCTKDTQPSDTAMLAVLDHAKKSIRLSQQDIGFRTSCLDPQFRWWSDGMRALGRAIGRNVDVQIVLSHYLARAGNGSSYAWCVPGSRVWEELHGAVRLATGKPDAEVTKLMKEKVHIAWLRFGPDPAGTWTNGWTFANHAKVMIVDDSVFYVGSSNVYTSGLQEFGYFVQHPAAAQTIITDYWEPMWKYSKVTEYVPR